MTCIIQRGDSKFDINTNETNRIVKTSTSYFDGSLLQLIGWTILGWLIIWITLGILYPWVLCMVYG